MAAKKSPAKARRGARGKGTVFQRGGVWIARKPVGRGPTGRTLYLERRGKTQAEALKRLAEAGPPGPETTVKEWAAKWIASLSVRPSTLAHYQRTVDLYLVPTLGTIRVRDLTAHQVETASRTWSKTLGPNTLRTAFAHLSVMLTAARRAKLVTENVATDARRPKGKRVAIDPFTPAELARIIAAASESPSRQVFALLASAGCRLGEALALDVGDFDPAARTIAITRTYCRRHGIGPPKSPRGIRTVHVPSVALAALIASSRARKTGPLFPTRQGTRRNHNTVRACWGVLLQSLGLRYRNPHQLRHSVATAMIGAAVALPDIAVYLGDAPETVLRTYVHPTGADPSAAMDRLFGAAQTV